MNSNIESPPKREWRISPEKFERLVEQSVGISGLDYMTTKNTKHTKHTKKEIKTFRVVCVFRGSKTSSNNPFVLQLGVMSKIREDAKAVAGSFQVVVNLSTMLVGDLFDRFNFQNNLLIADCIGDIFGF